jgi:GNAT superfamily N-acetyltransferase
MTWLATESHNSAAFGKSSRRQPEGLRRHLQYREQHICDTNPRFVMKPKLQAAIDWRPRLAHENDIPQLESLIPVSVRALQALHYATAQMDAALGPIFAVDRQLITDGTYFVVESGMNIVGCGGWSRRRSHYGGDQGRAEPDPELDPVRDAARIRAFFVHPNWARRGIGSSIMAACEKAIVGAGYRKVEIVATLAGEPLYVAFGYAVIKRFEIPMESGLKLPVVSLTKQL